MNITVIHIFSDIQWDAVVNSQKRIARDLLYRCHGNLLIMVLSLIEKKTVQA